MRSQSLNQNALKIYLGIIVFISSCTLLADAFDLSLVVTETQGKPLQITERVSPIFSYTLKERSAHRLSICYWFNKDYLEDTVSSMEDETVDYNPGLYHAYSFCSRPDNGFQTVHLNRFVVTSSLSRVYYGVPFLFLTYASMSQKPSCESGCCLFVDDAKPLFVWHSKAGMEEIAWPDISVHRIVSGGVLSNASPGHPKSPVTHLLLDDDSLSVAAVCILPSHLSCYTIKFDRSDLYRQFASEARNRLSPQTAHHTTMIRAKLTVVRFFLKPGTRLDEPLNVQIIFPEAELLKPDSIVCHAYERDRIATTGLPQTSSPSDKLIHLFTIDFTKTQYDYTDSIPKARLSDALQDAARNAGKQWLFALEKCKLPTNLRVLTPNDFAMAEETLQSKSNAPSDYCDMEGGHDYYKQWGEIMKSIENIREKAFFSVAGTMGMYDPGKLLRVTEDYSNLMYLLCKRPADRALGQALAQHYSWADMPLAPVSESPQKRYELIYPEHKRDSGCLSSSPARSVVNASPGTSRLIPRSGGRSNGHAPFICSVCSQPTPPDSNRHLSVTSTRSEPGKSSGSARNSMTSPESLSPGSSPGTVSTNMRSMFVSSVAGKTMLYTITETGEIVLENPAQYGMEAGIIKLPDNFCCIEGSDIADKDKLAHLLSLAEERILESESDTVKPLCSSGQDKGRNCSNSQNEKPGRKSKKTKQPIKKAAQPTAVKKVSTLAQLLKQEKYIEFQYMCLAFSQLYFDMKGNVRR